MLFDFTIWPPPPHPATRRYYRDVADNLIRRPTKSSIMVESDLSSFKRHLAPAALVTLALIIVYNVFPSESIKFHFLFSILFVFELLHN